MANGDIDNAAKALTVLASTNADGVMIGRAAHGAPWIFRDVNRLLTIGESAAALSRHAVRDIIRAHLTDLYSFYGEDDGVRFARKHLGWYLDKLLGTRKQWRNELRRKLMSAESTNAQHAAATSWLDTWVSDSCTGEAAQAA